MNRAPARILIVGAGGQGRIAADILLAGREEHGYIPAGFVDDRRELTGSRVLGLPVLGTLDQIRVEPHDAIVVAIGDNAARQRLLLELLAAGERIATIRHPFSSVANGAEIGDGCMISAGAVITPDARIGRGVLVNTGASIDHETVIEEFAHVGPGSVVGGKASIGTRVLLGTHSTVMTGCRVGADAVIGAGALVHRDIPPNVVAIGVPARVRRAR
jgi:sugar O-acyltransferase (sialic acid O-acetyltransferase NeuD family)